MVRRLHCPVMVIFQVSHKADEDSPAESAGDPAWFTAV